MDNKIKRTENFIIKAKLIHGNKYDYSLVNYINSDTKVKIVCPIHGEFEQIIGNHLNGGVCLKCSIENSRKTTKDFILGAKKVHGGKYDYTNTIYVKSDVKVKIVCPIHGEFEQRANSHLKGEGCVKCSFDKQRKSKEQFIREAKEIHGNIFDYSLVDYKNIDTKIKIICSIHGEFEQIASKHLNGSGCLKCFYDNKRIGNDRFIIRAKKIHGDKYDYSLVKYKGAHDKIIITCVIHGNFEQSPHEHLRGRGCPTCNDSKGELRIKQILDEHNIKYVKQKRFNDCKNKNPLPFDFYLLDYNVCIEFNGIQHYKTIDYFGGEKAFKMLQKNDKIKLKYCNKNNIKLIVIKYNENVNKITKIWD